MRTPLPTPSAYMAFSAENPAAQQGVLSALAEMWEAAFGSAITPNQLQEGALYPQSRHLPAPMAAAQSLLDTLQTERFLSAVCGLGETPGQALAACHAAAQRLGPAVCDHKHCALATLLLTLPAEEKQRFYHSFGCGKMHLQDPELLRTAREYLNRQLSPARAAAALYIHRNTLQYRLSRLEAETGLDLHRAEDAAAFWVWDALRAHLSGKGAEVLL